MRPGLMNKQVTLKRAPITTDDSDGFFELLSPSIWWASIVPQEMRIEDETRILGSRVTMRYHPQVSPDTCIFYGTRQLFVKSVQNVNEEDRELVLYCEETV